MGDSRRILLLVVVVLVASLGLAYAQKAVCRGDAGTNVVTADWCYTDLRALWEARGFDEDAVPYRTRFPWSPSALEYPPGIGFGTWAIALATDTPEGFVALSALTLAGAAAVTLWQLDVALRRLGRERHRLLRYVASPSLIVLGMQNWDLWTLAPVAAGLAAAAGRRPRTAALWFGLAAGIKWWPAILVVTLLVGPWAPGGTSRVGWRTRLAPAAIAAGAWVAVQLPAIALSPAGWWASIAFHLDRDPNRASLIGVVQHVGDALVPATFWETTFVDIATVVTFAGLVAGAAVVARHLHTGRLEPSTGAFALVILFLVTSKVVSVQFLLWLLPLVVLAPVGWAPVLAADVLNVAVWWLWAPTRDDPVPAFWASLALAALRTAILLGVLVRLLTRPAAAAPAGPRVAEVAA